MGGTKQKMSKKKEVQAQITSDAQWREVLKEPGCFFLEIYSEKWGQCACFKGTVQKMFYEHMGWCKFYAVSFCFLTISSSCSLSSLCCHRAMNLTTNLLVTHHRRTVLHLQLLQSINHLDQTHHT